MKGVRFSPSAYVDINDDKFFSSAQILTFWVDQNVYTWGYADGTGETINMTPNEYTQRYVLDRDFLRASSINVNQDMAFGNTSNNAASVYPKGTRVEFYIEPSSKESIDWSALRLVFEREGDVWYLVAVIHDEWST